MDVIIEKSKVAGKVTAPPSKSYAHRYLIGAMLSKGKSIVHNIALSADVKATMECIKAFGAKCEYKDGSVEVEGIDVNNVDFTSTLDCNECGSTIRFFTPLALLNAGQTTLTGSKKLLSRPMDIYEKIFKENGVKFLNDGTRITVDGALENGTYEVNGNVSSQFITGLLFYLPLLKGDSRIKVIPPFESKSYVLITMGVLKEFGIDVSFLDDNTLYIKSGSYKCGEFTNESDWSNGAFLYALSRVNSSIEVRGLNENSLQGDKEVLNVFDKIEKGSTVDLSDVPDLGPIAFAYSAVKGGTRFIGTKRLKIKESDRLEACRAELQKMGITLKAKDNSATVYSGTLSEPTDFINGHNDHRIVMAFAVLLTLTGGRITGCEAVNKSYPNFFEDLENLGVKLRYVN